MNYSYLNAVFYDFVKHRKVSFSLVSHHYSSYGIIVGNYSLFCLSVIASPVLLFCNVNIDFLLKWSCLSTN